MWPLVLLCSLSWLLRRGIRRRSRRGVGAVALGSSVATGLRGFLNAVCTLLTTILLAAPVLSLTTLLRGVHGVLDLLFEGEEDLGDLVVPVGEAFE